MKISKKEKIYLILTILIMITIFLFSAQNADDSAQISDGAYENVDNLIRGGLPGIVADYIQDNFRKFAHFFLYMLLGICCYGSMWEHIGEKAKTKLTAELALCVCVAYAMTDELHQKFVPGRSCEWRDVCIDGLGAVIGIALLLGIRRLKKLKKRKG